MTVAAFEMAKDDVRPDDEPSALDDAATLLEQDDLGQGWHVRDEEARLFGLDQDDERKRRRTSLTHHIAVVRLGPIYDQIVSRQFLPNQPSDDADAAQPEASPPNPTSVQPDPERPDTSRFRRFSRRPRAVATDGAAQADTYAGLGPVSADDSWPPMWLVIARNPFGGSTRMPSFRPTQGLASIRDNLTGRFGRVLSHAPDRSQYTRINPDASPDA